MCTLVPGWWANQPTVKTSESDGWTCKVRMHASRDTRDESLTSKALITESATTFWAFEIFPWELSQGLVGRLGVNRHAAVKRDWHGGGEWEGVKVQRWAKVDKKKKNPLECKFLRGWTLKCRGVVGSSSSMCDHLAHYWLSLALSLPLVLSAVRPFSCQLNFPAAVRRVDLSPLCPYVPLQEVKQRRCHWAPSPIWNSAVVFPNQTPSKPKLTLKFCIWEPHSAVESLRSCVFVGRFMFVWVCWN